MTNNRGEILDAFMPGVWLGVLAGAMGGIATESWATALGLFGLGVLYGII